MTQSAMIADEPQRMRALEQANKVRVARAGLKRQIAIDELSAADVILAPPDEARTWSVADLLLSQRRWGITRCRKFLQRNQITETKSIGSLTDRQRELLARELNSFASRELELV